MDSGKQQIKQMEISKHANQTHKCNFFKHTLFQSRVITSIIHIHIYTCLPTLPFNLADILDQ